VHLLRKQDLSIYYFLQDDVFGSYDFVNIEDGFPESELQLPTVSVEALDINPTVFELGNRVGRKDRLWAIDIFAQQKAQRDEFGYLIIDELENGIPVYDYDEGFPPSVSPTQLGALDVRDIRASPVVIFPEIQEKLYWRINVIFSTVYHPLTS
jgi:hypothetical protein